MPGLSSGRNRGVSPKNTGTGRPSTQYSGAPRAATAPTAGSRVTVPAPVPLSVVTAPKPSVPPNDCVSARSVRTTFVVATFGAAGAASGRALRSVSATAPAPSPPAATTAAATRKSCGQALKASSWQSCSSFCWASSARVWVTPSS